MLRKYKRIIYNSNLEELEAINKCLDIVLGYHPECTEEQVCKSIKHNKSDVLNYDFINEIMIMEGMMLFDIAVQKFGVEIWSQDAWRNKKCEELCPFGDICKKIFVKIDEERVCYGQLYYRNINMKSLLAISRKKSVKIIKNDGEVVLNLNSKGYDEEILSDYFFRYELFVMRFGDVCSDNKYKINGENVILYL